MSTFPFRYLQQKFSHTRFIFLLIIILNTLETKDHITKPQIIHKKHFEKDLKYCFKCFQDQIQHCTNFFEQLEIDKDFTLKQLLNFMPEICKRNSQLIQLKNSNEKLIRKYLFNPNKVEENVFNLNQFKRKFTAQQEKLQGMQYAPLKTLNNFIKNLQSLQSHLTHITICNYLLNNIQPLIFPILFDLNFPVPKTHAVCGFNFYQQYAGKDLYNFFKTDFYTKLEISKQLLRAAIKFSYGFNNYRLYITDLTADNIVYDKANKQLYFIDLDTIFIVDSTEAKYKTFMHKHIYIECPGCFAYVADDIASYNISDINIYSACQFLREDLYKQHSKGFLYPIPPEFTSSNSKLWQLLNQCVDCPDQLCLERFTVAKELINSIEEILHH